MPITAKLSKEFYEKFGNTVVDELVNWLNQVDATYRNELRELNEVNFARSDAKLEQRIGELRSEMHVGFAQANAKLEQRITEVKAALGTLQSRLEGRMATFEARIIRWMFLFWAGTLGTVIALQKL